MSTDELNNKQQAYRSLIERKQQAVRHKEQLERMKSLEMTVINSLRQLVQYLDGKTTKTEVVNQLKSIRTPDIEKAVEALNKLEATVSAGKLDISPLVKGLDKLEKQLTELPRSFPEAPQPLDTVKVSNLSDISFKSLESAVKSLKLEAPKVDVKPEVNVDAPDLKPIQDSLLTVVEAIRSIPQPEAIDVSKVEIKLDEVNKKLQTLIEQPKGGGGGGGGVSFQDSAGKPIRVEVNADGTIPTTYVKKALTEVIDVVDANNTYIGQAEPGSSTGSTVWRIKKIVVSGSTTTIGWAESDGSFSYEWDERATYTYG